MEEFELEALCWSNRLNFGFKSKRIFVNFCIQILVFKLYQVSGNLKPDALWHFAAHQKPSYRMTGINKLV